MSKTELLEEFSKLSPDERNEIWDALWTMEERHLLGISAPTSAEKDVLDEELEEYGKSSEPGKPWSEVESRLRNRP